MVPGRMGHRRIAKHADDVEQRVGVSKRRDIEQSGRADFRAADAGDVGELDGRRYVFARIEERGELIESIVGHTRDADVRLRLTGRARRLARAGQQLKQRGLSRGWKSDQTGTKHVSVIKSGSVVRDPGSHPV